MKRFKLIAKFFFEQKCHEIWKSIKTLPIAFTCLMIFSLICAVIVAISGVIGYCFFLIVPELKNSRDALECYIGVGFGILIISTFIFYVIYSFIKWIKENIDLAKERAERELGLTSMSNTIDKKVKHNGK